MAGEQLSGGGEFARPALDDLDPELAFQSGNVLRHGGLTDTQLLRRAGK